MTIRAVIEDAKTDRTAANTPVSAACLLLRSILSFLGFQRVAWLAATKGLVYASTRELSRVPGNAFATRVLTKK